MLFILYSSQNAFQILFFGLHFYFDISATYKKFEIEAEKEATQQVYIMEHHSDAYEKAINRNIKNVFKPFEHKNKETLIYFKASSLFI